MTLALGTGAEVGTGRGGAATVLEEEVEGTAEEEDEEGS